MSENGKLYYQTCRKNVGLTQDETCMYLSIAKPSSQRESNGELCESHSSIGADGKERPRQVERKSVEAEPIEPPTIVDVDDEEIDESKNNMFDGEEETESQPFHPKPKIIDMTNRHQSNEQAYYRKLGLGYDTYKRLARIYDVIDNFDIIVYDIIKTSH